MKTEAITKQKSWRDVFLVHPAADMFPMLPEEKLRELGEDIKKNGLHEEIVFWRENLDTELYILDGRNRLNAMELVGMKTLYEHEGDFRLVSKCEFVVGINPYAYVISKNIRRRHLTPEQCVALTAEAMGLWKAQVDRSESVLRSVKRAEDGTLQGSTKGEIARVAEAADVSKPTARKYLVKIADEKVKTGEITKQRAETIIQQIPKEERESNKYYRVEDWEKLSKSERADIISAGFESKYKAMNRQTNDSIDWAQYSENVVTGCLQNCPYCYARDIASRLFEYGFLPVFHPQRLAAPANIKVPSQAANDPSFKNIFANSMSDLFGKWVPVDWIEAVIEMARRNPQWNFLTLTKFPIRAAEFEFPDNWWMGTTVDAKARVDAAEDAFERIRCKTKWLSCEPMLEPLKFKRLDLFQWVVLGGASRSTQTPEWVPPFEWVADLHMQARAAGCLIYHKTNLGLEDSIRVRQFPWTENREKKLPKEFHYLKGM
jgi:protein gp37/polyhydroxyalkanoate synthesis regulator phasin